MTTYLVCPINGALPPDNGQDQSKPNNVVPTASDAIVTASTIIGSTSGNTIIVTTGANFAVGQWLTVVSQTSAVNPPREKVQITGIATNTLTVARSLNPVGTFAVGDYVLTGLDVNGNPPHCPLCGSGVNILSPAQVNFLTGVVAASQHPADVDKVLTTQTDSPLAQVGTSTTLTGQTPRISHGFGLSPGNWSGLNVQDGEPTTWNVAANQTNRGDHVITPETINGTVGP